MASLITVQLGVQLVEEGRGGRQRARFAAKGEEGSQGTRVAWPVEREGPAHGVELVAGFSWSLGARFVRLRHVSPPLHKVLLHGGQMVSGRRAAKPLPAGSPGPVSCRGVMALLLCRSCRAAPHPP